MFRSRSIVLLSLAGLFSVLLATSRSMAGPINSDFFGGVVHRPEPTHTPTPQKRDTPTEVATFTPTSVPPIATPTVKPPASTPTALMSATPSPTATTAAPSLTATVAATCNPETALGNEFAGSTSLTIDGVELYAQPETASVSGNLTGIFVNIASPPALGRGIVSGIVGIYSNNGGQPGTLLTSSAAFTSLAAGTNRFQVPGLVITQGTIYWLVLYIDTLNTGGMSIDGVAASGPLVKFVNLSSLPASYPTGSGAASAALNMEGDICK